MDDDNDETKVVSIKSKGNPNWVKGRSANPGGRPKTANNLIRLLCRRDTQKVYAALMDIIMNDEAKDAARVAAIKFHQENAWGKPPTSIKIETSSSETPQFMPAQQLAQLAQGRIEDFVYDLFSTGKLKEYLDKFKEDREAIITPFDDDE